MDNSSFMECVRSNYYVLEEDNYIVVYTHDKQVVIDKTATESYYSQMIKTA